MSVTSTFWPMRMNVAISCAQALIAPEKRLFLVRVSYSLPYHFREEEKIAKKITEKVV